MTWLYNRIFCSFHVPDSRLTERHCPAIGPLLCEDQNDQVTKWKYVHLMLDAAAGLFEVCMWRGTFSPLPSVQPSTTIL